MNCFAKNVLQKCHHTYIYKNAITSNTDVKRSSFANIRKVIKVASCKKILLTEWFILSLSVLFRKELPPTHTHPPTPGKFFSDFSFIYFVFAFSQVLACFYLKNAVIHLTDLISIFLLVTVKCSAKSSSHFIACIFLFCIYPLLHFIFVAHPSGTSYGVN